MKRSLASLSSMLRDPLFHRVCVATFGIPFIMLSICVSFVWHPGSILEWVGFSLILLVGAWGAFLFYAAVLGNTAVFNRASAFVETDADVLGALFVIAVIVIALPITLTIRKMTARQLHE